MDVKNVLLRITGDNSDAKRALRETAEEVKRAAAQEAEIRITAKTAGLKAEIDDVKLKIRELSAMEATPKIKIRIAEEYAKLELLERKIDQLNRKHVEVGSGGKGIAGGATGILGALGGIASFVPVLGAVVSGITSVASFLVQATSAAIKFGSSMAEALSGAAKDGEEAAGGAEQFAGVLASVVEYGLAAAAAVAALAAALFLLSPILAGIVQFVVGLVVAIGAMISSLAFATAAIGGMAAAFVAAAIPVAGLLIPVFIRLGKIIAAVAQQSKQGSAQQVSQAQQVAQAHRQVADAAQQVQDAQKNLADQTVQGYRAMQDAAERVKDAILGVAQAKLGIQDAALNARQARYDLKKYREEIGLTASAYNDAFKKFTDVRFHATGRNIASALGATGAGQLDEGQQIELQRRILAVKHALLDQKGASDRLHDATTERVRAEQDNQKYVAQGFKAYPGYIAAQKELTRARRAEADALRNVKTQSVQAEGTLGKLGKADQERAKKLKAVYDGLKGAFGPITDRILDGVLRQFGRFAKMLQDPAIHRAMSRLGSAITRAFDDIGKALSGKGARSAFVGFTKLATELAHQLGGRAFPAFVKAMGELAKAFSPILADVAKRFANWLEKIAAHGSSRGGVSRLAEFAKHAYDSFNAWWGVVKSLAGTLGAFFGATKTDGDSIAKILSNILDGWTQWLSGPDAAKHRKELHDWMVNSWHKLRDIYDTIKSVVHFFGKMAKAAKDVWDVIKATWNFSTLIHTNPFGHVIQFFKDFGAWVRDWLNIFNDLIHGKWSKLWHDLKQLWHDSLHWILDALKNAVNPFGKVGEAIGNALWKGIKGAADLIWGLLKRVVGTAIDAYNAVAKVTPFTKTIKNPFDTKPKQYELTPADAKALSNKGANRPLSRSELEYLRRHPNLMRGQHGGLIRRALGGALLGSGVDTVMAALQEGEYVLRKSVVDQLGLPALNNLNAGRIGAMGGRPSYHVDKLILPAPPSGGVPDAWVVAAQIGHLLEARGLG